eukprot:TRINITY_DN6753_c0_g3_i1.p1 TRINITY_DN6753_c0_g3~~TRINITY_DN6753_c0_g3_i1.p1  ORF type:complete len:350 (-),score=38.13 TRINITY_DN6753_c0_g3_i1:93-1142(-)
MSLDPFADCSTCHVEAEDFYTYNNTSPEQIGVLLQTDGVIVRSAQASKAIEGGKKTLEACCTTDKSKIDPAEVDVTTPIPAAQAPVPIIMGTADVDKDKDKDKPRVARTKTPDGDELDRVDMRAKNEPKTWLYKGGRKDELDMLQNLWWCTWCCCAGGGCSRSKAPFQLATNFCCFGNVIQSEPCKNPDGAICGNITLCCCFTTLYKFPPQKGTPRCIFLGTQCCGPNGGWEAATAVVPGKATKGKGLAPFARHLNEKFVPCFCCCLGLRCNPPLDCLDSFWKCGPCQCHFHTGVPTLEMGVCLWRLNCACLYCLCKVPPTARFNPLIACCGHRVVPVRLTMHESHERR